MIGWVLAATSLVIWLWLALARGGFWLGRENDDAAHRALGGVAPERPWPSVVAVVPARNEAALIGTTAASLLAQNYPGRLAVLIVDDHSEDGTAEAARAAAAASAGDTPLTVLNAPPLPADWTGKLWAVTHGVAHAVAADLPPDYLLLTDADVWHPPESLAALVASAEEGRLALSSLMVALRCESGAERAFIPAFVFFFQMIYPFAWVNDPRRRRVAAAAGGCMLVRRTALEAVGGIASIKGRIIDDCALGEQLKRVGPIRLALSDRVRSLRPCPSFAEIRRMVVRTAFAQLRFSVVGLVLVVAAMLLVFVAPVVLVVAADGGIRLLSLTAWMLMVILYAPMARRYRVSVFRGLALPLIAATYLALTIESAFQYGRGHGGVWKGRAQAPRRGASVAGNEQP